jgi:uncharacterized protein
MMFPDVNLLLYSVEEDNPFHATAKGWLEAAFNSGPGVGLAWLVLIGFVRLSTQPRILRRPLTVAESLATMNEWLLESFLIGAGTAGNLTNDAHLAVLAIENSGTVGTFDKDFKRFPGLKMDLLKSPPMN